MQVVAARLALRGVVEVIEVVISNILVEAAVLVRRAAQGRVRRNPRDRRPLLLIDQLLQALDPGFFSTRIRGVEHITSRRVLHDKQRRPRVAHGLDVAQKQPAPRLGVVLAPVVAQRQARRVALLGRDLLDAEEPLLGAVQEAGLLGLLLQVAAEAGRGGGHLAVGAALLVAAALCLAAAVLLAAALCLAAVVGHRAAAASWLPL